MLIRAIKLGTEGKDQATGLHGTVTHWRMDTSHLLKYLFQPRGLNPENGQPLEALFLEQERFKLPPEAWEEVDVPTEILGTEVEDMASGFKGKAVAFIRHINGCFHVVIQPSVVVRKTNTVVESHDFDLRGCKGKMIPKLTPQAKKKSQERNPSPAPTGKIAGPTIRSVLRLTK